MLSPFGVEHTEISKGLKPQHVAAMQRATSSAYDDGTFKAYKKATYAQHRLATHGLGQELPLSTKYYKRSMNRLTRTKRAERDKNRKQIFGSKETT